MMIMRAHIFWRESKSNEEGKENGYSIFSPHLFFHGSVLSLLRRTPMNDPQDEVLEPRVGPRLQPRDGRNREY